MFTIEACSASLWNWVDPWEEEEWSGLKRCSKIAIMRNIDINIAVATNPNEIAFIDDPEPSLLVCMFHVVIGLSDLDSFISNSLLLLLCKKMQKQRSRLKHKWDNQRLDIFTMYHSFSSVWPFQESRVEELKEKRKQGTHYVLNVGDIYHSYMCMFFFFNIFACVYVIYTHVIM